MTSRHQGHRYQRLFPKKAPRIVTLSLLLALLVPVGLLTLSLITFLSSSYSRPCLPFSLQRISTSGHRLLSCSSIPAPSRAGFESVETMGEASHILNGAGGESGNVDPASAEAGAGRFAGFLQSQKEAFMDDLRKSNLNGWTIAMGNEAGDLDSLASSIGFAYLSQTLKAERSIPLNLTPSSLMRLRPENLLAFQNARIPLSTLFHLESIPDPSTLVRLGAKFALVDHNRLLPAFSHPDLTDPVVAIIDHHEDEHQHSSALIREIVVPTGSCASLVTRHFEPWWTKSSSSPAGPAGSPIPPELPTFLLSAILIDTAGLKAGGKATQNDTDAAAFLYPLSTLASSSSSSETAAETLNEASPIAALTTQLQDAKFNVSDMSTNDLLLRDYKQYTLPSASSDFPILQVGVSTVPLGLKPWLERDGGWNRLLQGVDEEMIQKNLDIEGVLTSYNNKNGKHRRELLLVVRTGGAVKDANTAKRMVQDLTLGLEGSVEIELKSWDKTSALFSKDGELDTSFRVARVWKQGNAKATRKQVAPLLRDLIAKLH
ncbi:hypothetical protein BD324DRAFT_641818 [Kockovaella imperatae]|uniref:DHHA2 domain-containing protein n=1 Tax=Kockovaella imperatae TaxID=4999 RepID=A0A1Y1UHY6_9TREE|nr:hypothetical protein BD324DRAFT_641818 [Kockovaella imperatae]ORX37670.1 hypothetical protein BD324DRAFT_641818 [Kockovaella imperatae]